MFWQNRVGIADIAIHLRRRNARCKLTERRFIGPPFIGPTGARSNLGRRHLSSESKTCMKPVLINKMQD
jgi:hypothetical protein